MTEPPTSPATRAAEPEPFPEDLGREFDEIIAAAGEEAARH